MNSNNTKCFHCGTAIAKPVYYADIDDQRQPMCCMGCQAVAETIVYNGLVSYYEYRDHDSFSQKDLDSADKLDLNPFDFDEIQSEYLIQDVSLDKNIRKMILSIEGINCAACVWLLEKRIPTIDGVQSFVVHLTHHRAECCWDQNTIDLPRILLEIAKIGYRAHPYEIDQEERTRTDEQKSTLKRLAVSGFGFGQVMMFSAPLYSWFSSDMADNYREFFRVVSLIVTTPVLIYCGLPFFKSALNNIKSRFYSMDISITLVLLVVYCAGLFATISGKGEVYFDSTTMFLFFITLTRFLEMQARFHSATVTQTMRQQQPQWVTKINDGLSRSVPLRFIQVNDLIMIKPGTIIPVDGVVISNQTSVSEALLTGEMMPKLKKSGDTVVAGSTNIDTPVSIRVTQIGNDTTLAKIIKLYERAQFTKPKIVTKTQKIAHYFVLSQVFIALSVFLFWLPYSIHRAFWTTISVLVITCPCALSLATPIALTVAMNALSRLGFLCTRGHVLEGLAQCTDVVFDKTGTITEGKFTIIDLVCHSNLSQEFILQIAQSLESQSEHPIASAFKFDNDIFECNSFKTHPNKGLEGEVIGIHYAIGKPSFIHELFPKLNVQETTDSEYTRIILASSDEIIATFVLQDRLRSNAQLAIRSLLESGFNVHLLSGDNVESVTSKARYLAIKHYKSNCKPEDKLNYVKRIQEHGGKVVMFGDGINDAPVLMQADVSISMANAADITRVAADALLMNSDLSVILKLFKHAQKTNTIIRQCLGWAILYNCMTLPFAVHGQVQPYIAAILMSLSSIVVVCNALRLSRFDRNKNNALFQPQLSAEYR